MKFCHLRNYLKLLTVCNNCKKIIKSVYEFYMALFNRYFNNFWCS